MSSKDELEILNERASVFLETARDLSSKGAYDLACFNAEQAAQLYSEAALLETTGDFPRTQSIIELIELLRESTKSFASYDQDFVSNNREALKLLETAYLTSRYFAIRFTKEDALGIIAISEKAMKYVDEVRKGAKKSQDDP